MWARRPEEISQKMVTGKGPCLVRSRCQEKQPLARMDSKVHVETRAEEDVVTQTVVV